MPYDLRPTFHLPDIVLVSLSSSPGRCTAAPTNGCLANPAQTVMGRLGPSSHVHEEVFGVQRCAPYRPRVARFVAVLQGSTRGEPFELPPVSRCLQPNSEYFDFLRHILAKFRALRKHVPSHRSGSDLFNYKG